MKNSVTDYTVTTVIVFVVIVFGTYPTQDVDRGELVATDIYFDHVELTENPLKVLLITNKYVLLFPSACMCQGVTVVVLCVCVCVCVCVCIHSELPIKGLGVQGQPVVIWCSVFLLAAVAAVTI